MMSVREAELHDVPWLYFQACEFAKEYGIRAEHMPDRARAMALLTECVRAHVMFIAVSDVGTRVGMIGGWIAAHPFFGFPNVGELFWYVAPPARGTRAGALLLDRYIAESSRRIRDGADYGWVTLMVRPETLIRDGSLVKRGFERMETTYRLEVHA